MTRAAITNTSGLSTMRLSANGGNSSHQVGSPKRRRVTIAATALTRSMSASPTSGDKKVNGRYGSSVGGGAAKRIPPTLLAHGSPPDKATSAACR